MALCLGAPKKSLRFAGICAAGSVLGGMVGYGLGYWFMDAVGNRIIEIYGLTDKFALVKGLYQEYDAWAVGIAGFTPLPYKVFTITAGASMIDFPTFVVVSLVSRAARFFLVAGLIYRFGAPVRTFIEKYLNLLTTAFVVLLLLGFILVKWLL
jgi:membrane protein YqaA with SNARE-associated domain